MNTATTTSVDSGAGEIYGGVRGGGWLLAFQLAGGTVGLTAAAAAAAAAADC